MLFSTLVLALFISTTFAAPVNDGATSPLPVLGYSFPSNSSGASVLDSARKKGKEYDDSRVVGRFLHDYYHDADTTATFVDGDNGLFKTQWDGYGVTYAFKGYEKGDLNRVIQYSGTINLQKYSYLSLFGQIGSSVYYVVEYAQEPVYIFGDHLGSTNCDNISYDVRKYVDTQYNVIKYYSVRSNVTPGGANGHVQGKITFACHLDAWKKFGMASSGEIDEQGIMVAGYGDPTHHTKGSASITVS